MGAAQGLQEAGRDGSGGQHRGDVVEKPTQAGAAGGGRQGSTASAPHSLPHLEEQARCWAW